MKDIIIVTGLSGAGKTNAINCLEDLGYYCVDNMPPRLISDFLNLTEARPGAFEKCAFVMDIRGGQFFEDLQEGLDELDGQGIQYKIMYLEASDAAIIRRYKETRRAHPLAPDGDVGEGIQKEREKLAVIRKSACYIIDTTELKTSQLNAEIKRLLSVQDKDSFTLVIQSFGYKNGLPPEADWVLDVRFLPNPFYVQSLKNLTGNNGKVRKYVLSCSDAESFARRVTSMITDMIPSYIREGKYHLTVAVGCTGGRHRSVVMANEIGRRLEENGRRAIVKHRDLQNVL